MSFKVSDSSLFSDIIELGSPRTALILAHSLIYKKMIND